MINAHAAVVLAAGASTRLGRPKQLLRRDGETLLHRMVRLAAGTGSVSSEPEVMRQDTHGHVWAVKMSPDGNVWGATVNPTAGAAEKLDDVVFPLFPSGGGFPRANDDKD